MMVCLFETIDAERVRCQRCGFTLKTIYAAEPERVHARCRAAVPLGVGDTVAMILERIGFTALWRRWKGQTCGCTRRQAKMNRWLPYPRKVRGLWFYVTLWR